MLPINDEDMENRIPQATGILMLAAMIVFAAELFASDAQRASMVADFALIPAQLFFADAGGVPEPITLVSYMFLHASALHLFGNILFLFVFAQRVEAALGSERFAAFAIVAGAVAGLSQALFTLGSGAPIIGLSGMTSAIMGACLAISPTGRIRVWLLATFTVPAIILIPLWMLPDIIDMALNGVDDQGAAVGSHLAGFTFGFLCGPLLQRPGAERRFLA
ncbi:MAG: rhomboid family intramembrane serine protease [Alphaproteobacteria bacterium]|nr:rhomboid family intramembrane serine protease [Alphaproteobacteria bacterium]